MGINKESIYIQCRGLVSIRETPKPDLPIIDPTILDDGVKLVVNDVDNVKTFIDTHNIYSTLNQFSTTENISIPAYSSSITYRENQKVSFNGFIYTSKVSPNLGNSPTNLAYWDTDLSFYLSETLERAVRLFVSDVIGKAGLENKLKDIDDSTFILVAPEYALQLKSAILLLTDLQNSSRITELNDHLKAEIFNVLNSTFLENGEVDRLGLIGQYNDALTILINGGIQFPDDEEYEGITSIDLLFY
jgi:hypothetical protein